MGAPLSTRLYAILACILLVPIAATATLAASTGCAYQTPNGLVTDRDCDGIDDFRDNCREIANTDQTDANRNGIGDACDLIITNLLLDPGVEVPQGEYVNVKVQLLNNKAYAVNDVQVRVRSQSFATDKNVLLTSLQAGEQRIVEFVLKTPPCATIGKHELTITTDHKENGKVYTQTRYQRLSVTPSPTACAANPTPLDNTILDTIAQQETQLGGNAVYPITITNLNSEAKTYHLSLDSISMIGTYRIEPNPTFTLDTGKSQTVYLTVQTETFAPLGRNALHLYLESEDAEDETVLTLRIVKPVGASLKNLLATGLQLAFVLIALALVIGAAIIAYKKVNADHEDDAHDHDQGPSRGDEKPKRGKNASSVEKIDEDEEFQSYY